jgi:putative ABC transport system permease protein
VPGVREVTHATWFGGRYQDVENQFAVMPVVPEEFLRLYPEFVVPEEQQKAWIADRGGALVGRKVAERFGWKIGDRIPIQGTIFRRADGGETWDFVVDAIYEGREKGVDETQFFFHYDYFNEARADGQDLVGWYVVRVVDKATSEEVARRIDAGFANSAYETKTTTEKAFVQSFANQIGNIGAILRAVLTAVFFTILLVAGNTMAQSVRERIGELAVLKTLGFSDAKILGLVLGESVLLSGVAGGVGLLVGWTLVVVLGDPTGQYLPSFYFPRADAILGAVLVVSLGLASGVFPALHAMRLSIVEGLRRV